MDDQLVIEGVGELSDFERDRAWEVDRTPRPVVRQLVRELVASLRSRPRSCVDVCAGSGVWADELIAAVIDRWGEPPDLVCMVEARAEERTHLERLRSRWARTASATSACQRPTIVVCIEDWRCIEIGKWSLVVGNPAFSIMLAVISVACSALAEGGVLGLFGHTLGQRGELSSALFERFCPSEHWRVAGSIGFRGDGSACDGRDYGLWVWREVEFWDPYRAGWMAKNMPRLPSTARRWVVPPGRDHHLELQADIEGTPAQRWLALAAEGVPCSP